MSADFWWGLLALPLGAASMAIGVGLLLLVWGLLAAATEKWGSRIHSTSPGGLNHARVTAIMLLASKVYVRRILPRVYVSLWVGTEGRPFDKTTAAEYRIRTALDDTEASA